eukprot:TRINITY_DN66937_c4_g1_i1.p2 TRINITY_DN66937_c4_g1~~TRINITY_DN66937_c4_g1_i1.p2  ORF type:complete len:102 (+),score=4.61 TRINITY_DN66937_c4_g1_i1:213-518(+)
MCCAELACRVHGNPLLFFFFQQRNPSCRTESPLLGQAQLMIGNWGCILSFGFHNVEASSTYETVEQQPRNCPVWGSFAVSTKPNELNSSQLYGYTLGVSRN